MRRFLLVAAIVPVMLTAGCAGSEFHRDVKRFFAATDAPPAREPSLAAATRVDQVGRLVLAANPFAGTDVSFQTIGTDDPVIFHRDGFGVFVSDALVDRCKTDGELAAVLCTELGKMTAEKRNATRMGIADPLPDTLTVPNSLEAGGIPADQVRLAELAYMEQRMPKKTADRLREETTDHRKIAAEFLRSAGFDEAELDRASPILKSVVHDSPIVRQLGGPGLIPRWSR